MSTDATTVWGIDLGTTYSCIARVDEYGRPVVVNNNEGDPTTPSVVMFQSSEDIQVGKQAKRQLLMEPGGVCELVKRQMGKPDWRFEAHGQEWSATEVSAQILRAVVEDAVGTSEGTKVVITVPAYFGIAERDATTAAGEIAGLDVVDILSEPTAAALSYGFAQGADLEQTVLVYDLGGGTFDVTVIRLEPVEDGGSHIRVVATGGNHRLGGVDWDQRLMKLVVRKFQEENPGAPDPLDDDHSAGQLRVDIEDLKRALTGKQDANQFVMAGAVRGNVKVTRQEFEEATRELLQQTIDFTRDTVEKAKALGAPEIDRVLLVGGSSFMPQVKAGLMEAFPGWAPELEDPNQAVAKGAALFGLQAELRAMIEERIELAGGGVDAPVAPHVEEEIRREVAAERGMALAAVTKLAETKVTNVCSRGFGVKVVRDGARGDSDADFFVDHLIKPNTSLPVDPPIEGTYGTLEDNQPQVHVVLLQQAGDTLSEDMAHNEIVKDGHFGLPGNDPAGTPIRVTMAMDNSGVLTVTASHPRIPEPLVFNAETGQGHTEAEKAESKARVDALRRM